MLSADNVALIARRFVKSALPALSNGEAFRPINRTGRQMFGALLSADNVALA